MTQRRLRLLLAEGSPGEAAAALYELYDGTDPGLDLTVVSRIATLLPTIKVVDPEVILLDLGLNLREPMDAVHLVHRTAPGVPLIVIADPAEKEQAIRSLTEGAMDYILKGHIDAHTLERVLRTALERNTLKGLTDLLRDQVTALYTRDGFLTVGARRHEEAMRGGSPLVLICVRFENLQALRDTSGPGTADRALNDVAGLLKGCCRRSDVVGRMGEAQFVILGVDAVAPSAQVMCNRLEQHLAVHNQARSPWGPIDLRTSIGSWTPQDAGTFAEFLDAVESRLRPAAAEMKT
jgi:diguanylate cyclase (GGDEF)-like protein